MDNAIGSGVRIESNDSNQAPSSSLPVMELEHAIGFSGIPAGLQLHPNGNEYMYPAGGCIVIASFADPHNQVFLRGHDANITCLAMSPNGALLASGQFGSNADVLVWDVATRRLLYRFSEHDSGINAVGFSHDGRLLCTVGNDRDGRLFIWDTATGNIVTTQQKLHANVMAVAWGGFARDVKRRDTSSYLFATGGARLLQFWILNPLTGELAAQKVEFGTPVVRDYTCVAFTPDKETLCAGTTSGDFAVVNVKNRRFLHLVTACACGVLSMATLPHGNLLVGGGDGSLLFFNHEYVDVGKAALHGPITGISVSVVQQAQEGHGGHEHSSIVQCLAGTRSGCMYRLVDVRPGALNAALLGENHSDGILRVAFAPFSNNTFATVSRDCTIRIWDASDYAVVVKATVQNAGLPTCLAYSLGTTVSPIPFYISIARSIDPSTTPQRTSRIASLHLCMHVRNAFV